MKKLKYILVACGLFMFFENSTYAIEKTQYLKEAPPLETKEQSKNFSEYEIFEKTYENKVINLRFLYYLSIAQFH